jgi:hypothetical protein
MLSQKEKAETFRVLHERDGAFVIPNPLGCRLGSEERRRALRSLSG